MMQAGVLRFSTAGSVDDGKSTLIGRLLYDAKSIFEDQMAHLVKTTARRGGVGGNVKTRLPVDLALLTDGLIAEREQGITIDVAYRYFATPERKFIIADTPGHEQYTRNMVTGASTAELTIILVDAARGVSLQSRRHALIASLLGIRTVVVAINKMDLVDWSEARFAALREEFSGLTRRLGLARVEFLPMSALHGDMVVERGSNLDWYEGPTLIELLNRAPLQNPAQGALRFPVQLVSRPGLEGVYTRGYMGRIEAGSVRVGDSILVQPSGQTSRVRSIVSFEGTLERAEAPHSVTLVLADDLDVSRGDAIVAAASPARVEREFAAMLAWMDGEPLVEGRRYLLKHGTRLTQAVVESVEYRLDVQSLARSTGVAVCLNDIARVRIHSREAIAAEAYADSRSLGGFILIDEVSHQTVAAGMIEWEDRWESRLG